MISSIAGRIRAIFVAASSFSIAISPALWFYLLPLFFHFKEQKFEIEFDELKPLGGVVFGLYFIVVFLLLTEIYAKLGWKREVFDIPFVRRSLMQIAMILILLMLPRSLSPSHVWLYHQVERYQSELMPGSEWKRWQLNSSTFLIFDLNGGIIRPRRGRFVWFLRDHFYICQEYRPAICI
jgi:hypothetical protein